MRVGTGWEWCTEPSLAQRKSCVDVHLFRLCVSRWSLSTNMLTVDTQLNQVLWKRAVSTAVSIFAWPLQFRLWFTEGNYIWQFHVEIVEYSFACFDCTAMFKVLYCWTSINGGFHMCFIDAWITTKLARMSFAFNRCLVIWHFENSDATEIHGRMMQLW